MIQLQELETRKCDAQMANEQTDMNLNQLFRCSFTFLKWNIPKLLGFIILNLNFYTSNCWIWLIKAFFSETMYSEKLIRPFFATSMKVSKTILWNQMQFWKSGQKTEKKKGFTHTLFRNECSLSCYESWKECEYGLLKLLLLKKLPVPLLKPLFE